MQWKVWLTISGRQWSGHDEPQHIRLTTEGLLTREDQGWSVVYDESVATGMEGTRTTIHVIRPEHMSLIRTGTHQMELAFEKGNRHITRMSTPYGDLDVTVYTSLVDSQLDESGGLISLGYTIDINKQQQVNTRLDITIERCGRPA